jgi:hypothetical protein
MVQKQVRFVMKNINVNQVWRFLSSYILYVLDTDLPVSVPVDASEIPAIDSDKPRLTSPTKKIQSKGVFDFNATKEENSNELLPSKLNLTLSLSSLSRSIDMVSDDAIQDAQNTTNSAVAAGLSGVDEKNSAANVKHDAPSSGVSGFLNLSSVDGTNSPSDLSIRPKKQRNKNGDSICNVPLSPRKIVDRGIVADPFAAGNEENQEREDATKNKSSQKPASRKGARSEFTLNSMEAKLQKKLTEALQRAEAAVQDKETAISQLWDAQALNLQLRERFDELVARTQSIKRERDVADEPPVSMPSAAGKSSQMQLQRLEAQLRQHKEDAQRLGEEFAKLADENTKMSSQIESMSR